MSAAEKLVKLVEEEDAEELNLADKGLRDLPLSLFALEQLTSLNLADNNLVQLPHKIGSLNSLTALDVSNNALSTLPRELDRLKSLKSFKVSGNKFGIDVEKVAQALVDKATLLDLSTTKLKLLCPEVQLLANTLKELVLDDNDLTSLPAELCNLAQLERLSVRANRLQAIEHDICDLQTLTELDLSGNAITRVSSDIANLGNLILLNLSANNLTSIPDSVLRLPHLHYLSVAENKITEIPAMVCNLSKLKTFDVSKNKLTDLPRGLFQLFRLQRLLAADNELTEIPYFIHELKSLQELDLDGNKIAYIYNDLGSLADLKTLKLRRNHLAEVSSTMGLLPKLDRLMLKDNPELKTPPENVVKERSLVVLEYLRSNAKKRFIKDTFMRIITLGDAGVGKTTLLRYLKTEEEATVASGRFGILIDDWHVRAMDEKTSDSWKIHFETWDFSLPQTADEVLRLYMSGRSLFLVVVKLGDPKADHWIRLIKSRVRNAVIMLAVTHCDSKDHEKDLKKVRDRYGADVSQIVGVSCKKGTNIRRLTALLSRETLNNRYWRNVVIPAKYDALDDAFNQVDVPIISREEFTDVAIKAKITKPAQQLRGLRYLRDHARVICSGSPAAGELIVTKPVWFFDCLVRLFAKGEASLSKATLSDLFGDQRKRVMKVLVDFKIAVPDGENIWIPSLAAAASKDAASGPGNAALDAAIDVQKVQAKIAEWVPDTLLRLVYRFSTKIARKFFSELTIEVSHQGKVEFEQDAFVLTAAAAEGVSVLIARAQPDVIEMYFKAKHIKIQSANVYVAEGSALQALAQKLNDSVMRVGFSWNSVPTRAVTDELPLICLVADEASSPAALKKSKKSQADSSDSSDSTGGRRLSSSFSEDYKSSSLVGLFLSRQLAAEEKRRGVHYHYSQAASRYILINPQVELPSFDENDLVGLTPVPSLSHLSSAAWRKREVVLVRLDDSFDLKALAGQPSSGLVLLNHKNIRPIMAINPAQKALLVANTLEYSLYDLLRDSPDEFTKANYLKIAIDIGEALAHMHTARPPIYAQNLSCKNISISKQNNIYKAKVSLFGAYSPKSAKMNSDKQEDNIHAYGLILAQLVSRAPADEDQEKPKTPKDCPTVVSSLVEKCCAENKAERPQMDDVLRELYKIAITTSTQLRAALQNELDFASTNFLIQRMGIAPLTRFLQDRSLRDKFYEYLLKEYSSENLIFHEAVESYKSARSNKRPSIAKRIAEEIMPKINVPEHILEPIKKKIEKDTFPPNLFENAQREIITLLENDPYKRFTAAEKKSNTLAVPK